MTISVTGIEDEQWMIYVRNRSTYLQKTEYVSKETLVDSSRLLYWLFHYVIYVSIVVLNFCIMIKATGAVSLRSYQSDRSILLEKYLESRRKPRVRHSNLMANFKDDMMGIHKHDVSVINFVCSFLTFLRTFRSWDHRNSERLGDHQQQGVQLCS